MIKQVVFFLLLIIITHSAWTQVSYHLPKVLFITSGADQGKGTVSDGVVMALQAFNNTGSFVRLEDRKILLQPEKLSKYDILIVPTIAGYHDQPQKYSLTYMSDMELENIAGWVQNGGTLVTDVNMGRNTLGDTDRILKIGALDNNSTIGKISGARFKEINTADFEEKDTDMHIWERSILKRKEKEIWRLIPVATQSGVQILAQWENGKQNYPAIILNRYQKGNVFLLPAFYVLHPINDGGLSTKNQIDKFYSLVFQTSIGKQKNKVRLSSWKDGYTSVYSQAFDDGGSPEQYKRIFDFLDKTQLPTVFFVTPAIDPALVEQMNKQRYISIQGHSYNHPDFRKLNFFETETEFLSNRQFWNKKFTGFRFPYVSNSFWGMYMLNELGFAYETSIAANHFEFIRGSVVPYNIPIFNKDFFCTLDVLEISQIYHSDWFFYQKTLEKKPYTLEEQKEDAKRFKEYLYNYYNKVVKPNKGVMVFLGHPMYSGISEITLQPLQDLISYLHSQNVWIASLNEVADRWNKFKDLSVSISEKNNEMKIYMDASGQDIPGLTLVLEKKPNKIVYSKSYKLKKVNDTYYLIFDVNKRGTIIIKY